MELSEQWKLLNCGSSTSILELVNIPGRGRGLKVAREVEPGETLLVDKPLVIGPSEGSSSVGCSGCCLSKANLICQCNLLFCSEACKKRWHSEAECKIVVSLSQYTSSLSSWLMVIRAYLTEDPRIGLLVGDTIQDNDDFTFLSSVLSTSNEVLSSLSSVLKSNTFRRGPGRALCPALAMVNHSCVANCRVRWEEGQGEKLALVAKKRLLEGEEVTITYCSTMLGTPARQKKLVKSKGFQCLCSRCQDPSEAGTVTGGLKCSKCRKKNILPRIFPGKQGLAWECDCGFQANSDKVDNLLDGLETELKELEMITATNLSQIRAKVQAYTAWIEKRTKILPANSYLLLQAAGGLVLLLGHLEDNKSLALRVKLIQQRLKVLDIVDGVSMSRMKGFELFRLYLALKKHESQEADRVLLEADLLLINDVLVPKQVEAAVLDLEKRLTTEQIEEIRNEIRTKYNFFGKHL